MTVPNNGNQQNLTNDHQDENKTKRKCRGNRKAQHLRRRIRCREQKMNNMNNKTNIVTSYPLNHNTVTYHENSYINEEQQTQNSSLNDQHNSTIKNKRKREDSSKKNHDLNMSRSLSQLSISLSEHAKKKKSMRRDSQSDANGLVNDNSHNNRQNNKPTTTTTKNKKAKKTTEEDYNDQSLSMYHMQSFKPHYLRVSDDKFKQMLSNVMQGDDGDKIIQSLLSNQKLQIVRQMMEVANNVYYFDLQRQLWQEYYSINLKVENNIGTPRRRFSKSDAKQHNTCHMARFPKHAIEKRQQTIVHQMQRATNEYNQYLAQLNTWTSQCQPPVDSNILSNTIIECVNKGQHRLRQEFDYKKKMLELNSNDHALISKVYELRPNEEQLRLAKLLWQVTADELKSKEKLEILRKRIFLQRLPASVDSNIDQLIDHVRPMLSDPVLDKDHGTRLASNYSKTITQFKYDLMTLDLNTLQNIIHGHERLLIDLQDQLSQICTDSLRHAIKNRQQAMRHCHEIYVKHKLNTFFDEAPATVVSNE